MHLRMGAHGWFGTLNHRVWRNPLKMKRNMPWGSTLAPQLCKAFPKELIGGFWGKLWISTTSHGFLVYFSKTKMFCPFIPIHSTPSFISYTFCWVNYVDVWGNDVTTRQINPWQLWDHGCQRIFYAPPSSSMDSIVSPKVKTTKGKGIGVRSLIRNTLGGRRACWSSEMGLGRLISTLITHTDLHKPNNKLVSV
jgi:hypothetical protein